MDLEYCCAWLQQSYVVVVWLILTLFLLCGCDRGEWCKCQCQNTSAIYNYTPDEYSYFVSKIISHNDMMKGIDNFLAPCTLVNWLVIAICRALIYFFPKGSYHYCRVSLILLHKSETCSITPSLSTSLGSQLTECICIQLVSVIVVQPYIILSCPLSDLWLSIFHKFVPWMNCIFLLNADQEMSTQGPKHWTRTN